MNCLLQSILLAVLLQLCDRVADATIAVPVIVSTVSRATPNVYDLTIDGNGNMMYVSPNYNGVYRLTADGAAYVLAGSGTSSTGTTNGIGTAARPKA